MALSLPVGQLTSKHNRSYLNARSERVVVHSSLAARDIFEAIGGRKGIVTSRMAALGHTSDLCVSVCTSTAHTDTLFFFYLCPSCILPLLPDLFQSWPTTSKT